MPNRLRRWLSNLLMVVVSLTAISVSAFYAYGDKIQDALVDQLNGQLDARLDIERLSWSVVDPFPQLSLRLEGVRLSEAHRPGQDLLRLKQLNLAMDLQALFFDQKVVVHRLRLQQGFIRLYTDAQGRVHYDILPDHPPPTDTQPKEPQTSSRPVAIALEQIILEEVTVRFRNDLKRQQVHLRVDRLDLSGAFSEQQFEAAADLRARMEQLRIEDQSYLAGVAFSLSTSVSVDQSVGRYQLQATELRALESVLRLQGQARKIPRGVHLDLQTTSEGVRLERLLRQIPEDWRADYRDFDARGLLQFQGSIQGPVSPTQNPVVQANFKLEDGHIARRADKDLEPIRDLHFQGRFESQSQQHPEGYVQLKPFHVLLGGRRVEGALSLNDFSRPQLELHLDGGLSLAWAHRFFPFQPGARIAGALETKSHIQAHKVDSVRWKVDRAEGYVKLRKLAYQEAVDTGASKPIRVAALDARIDPDGAQLLIQNVRYADMRAGFQGQAPNLWYYLSGRDAILTTRGRLTVDTLPLHQLVGQRKPSEREPIDFPAFLDAHLEVRINHLLFDAFHADQVIGELTLSDTALMIPKLRAQTLQGDFSLSGYLTTPDSSFCRLYLQSRLRRLDLRQLMAETDNLGQEVLRKEHLKGKLTADMSLQTTTDPFIQFHEDSVRLKLDFNVEDGALVEFPPLMDLIGFIKPKTLRTLRFYQLTGGMNIQGRQMKIDPMIINSSALDMKVHGAQHLDRKTIDYRAQVRVSTLLKDERADSDLYQKVIREEDEAYAFLRMTGTIDDPVIQWDDERTADQLKRGLKEEGEELRQAAEERRRRREARRRRNASGDSSQLLQSVGEKLKELF